MTLPAGPGSSAVLASALAAHQAGKLDEAVDLYRRVLAHEPDHAQALHMLGMVGLQKGDANGAADLIRRAVALSPGCGEFYGNLGLALAGQGKIDQAVAAYRRALDLGPDSANVQFNLGNALARLNQLDAATAAYRQAIHLRPHWAEAHHNLATTLQRAGDIDNAIAELRQAISARPNYLQAHVNLATALLDSRRYEQAIFAYRELLGRSPENFQAMNALGYALAASGEFEQALHWFERALVLSPHYALARWNRSLELLRRGDYSRGWAEYEWRWQRPGCPGREALKQPVWDGGELGGRRILIYAEQGFGDAFQFIRYLPEVVRRGGRVIVVCHHELHRVLAGVAPVEQWVAGEESLPEHDVQAALLSLPMLLGKTPEDAAIQPPYLWADKQRSQQWQQRLANDGRLKIGLVWAGRQTAGNERRSLPSADLADLSRLKNVTWISLQKGEAATRSRLDFPIIDWTEELRDFADTAALIDNLDLIITIDTAVAHLAGAMGRRTWILLPLVSDWRWMVERDDSPWYPTARLFRQQEAGKWSGVANRIVRELEQL